MKNLLIEKHKSRNNISLKYKGVFPSQGVHTFMELIAIQDENGIVDDFIIRINTTPGTPGYISSMLFSGRFPELELIPGQIFLSNIDKSPIRNIILMNCCLIFIYDDFLKDVFDYFRVEKGVTIIEPTDLSAYTVEEFREKVKNTLES